MIALCYNEMSDHEARLKANQENSFLPLHDSIKALKEYSEIFRREPHKFDQKTYDKLVKDVDDAEADCKEQVDAYIQYLEENVDMYRKGISGAS